MTADGRTLPWRILGRAVKPLTGVVLAADVMSLWSEIVESADGYDQSHQPGLALFGMGVVAVMLLTIGLFAGSNRCERWGLVVSAGYWSGVAVFLLLSPFGNVGAATALIFACLAGSLLLLEHFDSGRRGG